jgi:hypothetical protein
MTTPEPEDKPAAADGGPAPARPDWLVGAEEGVDAELTRKPASVPTPGLRLIKPGSGAEAGASGPGAPEAPPLPPSSGDAELELGGASASPPPVPSRSGGHGDLELASDPAPAAQAGGGEALRITDLRAKREARASEKAAPEKKVAWSAAASSVPKLRLVQSKPATPVAAQSVSANDDDEKAASGAFPDDAPAPAAAHAATATSHAAPRAKTIAPAESWWLVALDRVRYERRLQLLIVLLVVALIGLIALSSGGGGTTPIAQIRQHPEKYDGRSVTVEGRVGEVFSVGGGYAFYLHQGRDTLVVFTRSRTPVSRQKVSVKGSISTGFLDGEPRQSLFEAT